jgi:hypothetical protein
MRVVDSQGADVFVRWLSTARELFWQLPIARIWLYRLPGLAENAVRRDKNRRLLKGGLDRI